MNHPAKNIDNIVEPEYARQSKASIDDQDMCAHKLCAAWAYARHCHGIRVFSIDIQDVCLSQFSVAHPVKFHIAR